MGDVVLENAQLIGGTWDAGLWK